MEPALNFDLVDLRLFINVAEESSLTKGGDRSNLSLSAASMRIKSLETALGTQLLYRCKTGTTLTQAGQVLLQHARAVFQEIERLRGDIQQFAAGVKGHVRVFANTTAITEFLPIVLGNYLLTHPPMTIDLQERLSVEIVRAVHEGIADIGFIAGNIRTDGLETLPYKQDRLVLACAMDHPLARRSELALRDALEYDFIGLDTHSAIHAFLNEVMELHQSKLRVRIQVGSFDAMCQMIEANVGVGILPETAARRHARSTAIHLVGLLDEWAVREMKICFRKFSSLPTFARQLIEYTIDYDMNSPKRVAVPS